MIVAPSGIVFAAPTDAICNNPNAEQVPEVCKGNDPGESNNPITGPNGILSKVINILSFVTGVVAVIMIMYAGFRYVTANGDSGAVTQARNIIIYSVVGLLVVVLSRFIVIYILGKML